jgi:peroxiredoxin Q/BCP
MVDAYGALMGVGFANRWTYYIGVDGKVLKIDKATKPATAGKDLTRTMEELGFPKL